MKPLKFANIFLKGYSIMTKKRRFGVSQALSRGLSETIGVVENNAGIFRSAVLPLSRIELDPENPRKLAINLEDVRLGLDKQDVAYEKKAEELERLKEMAATIISSGVINPIVVYKRGEYYRVVAGERRCLASILAGKNEIEARVFNDKPQGYELKLIQWIENTAREDLSLNERIGNIVDIIREYQNQNGTDVVTATLLKSITGLSLSQANFYVTVMKGPEDVKVAIENGQIRNLDKAATIATVESANIRKEAIDACFQGCTLKDLRAIIAKQKSASKVELKPESKQKRGRVVTRVNMGFTVHPQVVQRIVDSVMSQSAFEKYAATFSKVNWEHMDHATQAFRKLIDILENETVRKKR
jgi:ParB family chromosome partitioning protein